MSKESSYELLQKKKWRAITYDWEILSTYGNQSRLYCLTDFQVAWLLSNTQYMRWSTRWDNCPCTSGDLDTMAAEMEYNLMSCLDIQPWQMDYLYEQAVDRQFQDMNTAYTNGGIAELNANTPTDFYSGDDSSARIDALCMACETYVKSYAQRWLQQAQIINGALNFIGGIINLVPYLGDIAIQAIGGLAGVTQQKVDAMQDNVALDAVVCCMRDGLYSEAVNQTIFEASLDGCSFTPGTNEEIVREIISSDIDVFDNWLTFLNALGDAYTYTSKGVQYDCPCIDPNTWLSVLDLTISDYGFVFDIIDGEQSGSWVDGVGLVTSDISNSGEDIRIVSGNFEFGDGSANYWKVEATYTEGTTNDGALTAVGANYRKDNVPIANTLTLLSFNDISGTPFPLDKSFVNSAVDTFRIYIRSSRGSYNGSATVTAITLSGSGPKPAGLP